MPELATLIHTSRVAIGIRRRRGTKLMHLSHSARVGKRMNLLRRLEEAMEEVADQLRNITYPPLSGQQGYRVSRLHQQLAERDEFADALISLPLYHVEEQLFSVVTLERDTHFSDEEALRLEALVRLVGVALREKQRDDRWIGRKLFDSLVLQLKRLFGPGHFGRKLVVLGLLAMFIILATWRGDYRLATETQVAAPEQRILAAPFEGYIAGANYHQGDLVEEGAVLVRLDDQDYRLERLRTISQIAKLIRHKERHMAEGDRVAAQLDEAQVEQHKVELEMAEMKLARSQVRAPFTGLLVSGDLSRRLSARVEQGEPLFELVPVNAYRLELAIPETRIVDVAVGDRGDWVLVPLPDRRLPFAITHIHPGLGTGEGSTHFVAEAWLL